MTTNACHLYPQVKQKDYHLSHIGLQAICRMIHGTCGSMGITVEGLREARPMEGQAIDQV